MLLIMGNPALPALAPWANFYSIVGSAAGALIGLQFVAMTLVAQAKAVGSMRVIRAFGTPTVVHFCAALLISAVMSAPWEALSHLGVCLGASGTTGFAYSLIVVRHARKQTGYAADAGDWLSYIVFPMIAYAGLAAEGILLFQNVRFCLFLIATSSLLFLLIGIRNAWDAVTHIAVHRQRPNEPKE